VSVAWTASTDNVGVARYFIFRDGSHVASVTTTTDKLSGLSCGHSYTIGVSAHDAAGNRSATRSITGSTSPCPDTTAPTAPSNLHVAAQTTTTLTVAWTASTDNVRVASYSVSLNSSHPLTVTGTSTTLSGLSCGQSYIVGVTAFDAAGNRSATTSKSASTTACSTLSAGQSLHPGQYLLSPHGAYRLVMQGDGNLVEYQGGTALWASNTGGDNGAVADMQSDGNLVIYLNGVAKWASGTNGFSGDQLVVQDDSNLVIYQGATAIWDRHSGLLGGGSTSCFSYGYACTPGYTGANASGTWAWTYYGGTWAQTPNGYHNCTLYVAWRLAESGMPSPGKSWGNAYQWAGSLGDGNHTPTVGSVAWWGVTNATPMGHVAYVEQVSGSNVFIRADNYDTTAGYTTSGWVAASSVPLFLHPHG
jgi:surface antigen/chitodextrinase